MIIGTCGLCGGPVETPDAWLGTLPAPATCKNCGAVRPQHGPVIDMQRTERRSVPTEDLGGVIEPKPVTTGERYLVHRTPTSLRGEWIGPIGENSHAT